MADHPGIGDQVVYAAESPDVTAADTCSVDFD